MKTQRILVVLTAINLALLSYQAINLRGVDAQTEPQLLRGTGIEIVDTEGRLRAQLKVEPPGKTPDGAAYDETVLFRLITADGKPRVKLATDDNNAGLSFVGSTDMAHVILKAEGDSSFLKLNDESGTERRLEP